MVSAVYQEIIRKKTLTTLLGNGKKQKRDDDDLSSKLFRFNLFHSEFTRTSTFSRKATKV